MAKDKISDTNQSIPCFINIIFKLINDINDEIYNIYDMRAYNSFQKFMGYVIDDYLKDLTDSDIVCLCNIENVNQFFYKNCLKPIDCKKIIFWNNITDLQLIFTKYGIKHYKILLDEIYDILIKKDYILKSSDIENKNYIYYTNLCKLKKKDRLMTNKQELCKAYRILYNIRCKN